MEYLLIFLVSFSLTVLLLSNAALRRERRELEKNLRRVLRAASGHIQTQDNELGWYRSVCQLIPHPIFVTDTDKKLIYTNPAAQEEFGFIKVGEAVIQRLRDHNLESVFDEALKRGHAEPKMINLQDKDFLVRADTWIDSNGVNGGAVMMMQDVTRLKRLARARRDMASNLSHELRTPLASIKLMSETLLNGGLEEAKIASRFVRRIAAENEAMIRLIEDLTALSWIESRRTPLRLERVNLRDLVQQRLTRLAPQQELKQIHFQLNSPPTIITELDPERFGQVLTNIFDNAIKYSPKGGTIHITIHDNHEATTLVVRDEGPGILPSDLPRIFERFYKGDPVRTRSSVAGTGLGLAIAKHLVQAHNGTIKAENNLDRGATFTIRLLKD